MNSDPHLQPGDFLLGLAVIFGSIFVGLWRAACACVGIVQDAGYWYRIEHTRKPRDEQP